MRPALILLAALSLSAHDLYLMPASFTPRPGAPLMVSIHNGDSFPASEGPTDPRRVLGGQISDLRIAGKATHGFVTAPRAVVAVHTEPRTFQLAPEKFEAYLKEEGLDHAVEWRRTHAESSKPGRETYSKYAKTILTGAGPREWSSPANLDIEFVPESDPSAGGSVPVRVLFRGKPVAGLQVEAAHESGERTVLGRTGGDGRIVAPIVAKGKWRLHTVHIERSANSAEADWRSYWASLTFESR